MKHLSCVAAIIAWFYSVLTKLKGGPVLIVPRKSGHSEHPLTQKTYLSSLYCFTQWATPLGCDSPKEGSVLLISAVPGLDTVLGTIEALQH